MQILFNENLLQVLFLLFLTLNALHLIVEQLVEVLRLLHVHFSSASVAEVVSRSERGNSLSVLLLDQLQLSIVLHILPHQVVHLPGHQFRLGLLLVELFCQLFNVE